MGGNVWQWCEDWDDNTHRFPVTRGNSWAGWDPNYLLSSFRAGEDPVKRSDVSGFVVWWRRSPRDEIGRLRPPESITNEAFLLKIGDFLSLPSATGTGTCRTTRVFEAP